MELINPILSFAGITILRCRQSQNLSKINTYLPLDSVHKPGLLKLLLTTYKLESILYGIVICFSNGKLL